MSHDRQRKKISTQSTQAAHARQKNYRARPLITTAIIPLYIERLSHEGRGVAHYQAAHSAQGVSPDAIGKTVLVRYGLVGETVQAQLTQSYARFDEAEALSVQSESPARVVPFCRYFGTCGGCALQHMAYAAQVDLKQHTVSAHLHKIAQIEPEQLQWLPPITNDERRYRRRARFSVQHDVTGSKLGFRAVQQHQVIDIEDCAILDAKLASQFANLKPLLFGLDCWRMIDSVQCVAGDTNSAWLLTCRAPLSECDVQRLVEWGNLNHSLISIQINQQINPPHHRPVPQLLSGQAQAETQAVLAYQLAAFAVDIRFEPTDFIQVNRALNQAMVATAMNLLQLQAGERVLDLFCGLGNFALPAAQLVGSLGQVIGVEGMDDMVSRAQHNAARQGLSQVQFYCQDLTQRPTAQWAKQSFDALIIDPPRSGAAAVMRYIAQFDAARMVYISCDSATLARDLQILQQVGYRVQKVGVMDMFAFTEHVETIVLLTRVTPPLHAQDEEKIRAPVRRSM